MLEKSGELRENVERLPHWAVAVAGRSRSCHPLLGLGDRTAASTVGLGDLTAASTVATGPFPVVTAVATWPRSVRYRRGAEQRDEVVESMEKCNCIYVQNIHR